MTLEELFHEHHTSLFRFLARMTGDEELARDMVQETFVTIAARGTDTPSKAWLFQIARNLTRSALRKRHRRLRLLEAGRHRLDRPSPARPDADTERAEARRAVRQALAALSEKERTILLMREEGFSHRDIAAAVGTTTGSVGTMYARALSKLDARLGPTDQEAS
jgi:RNA polymerase sigma factor (sigma-70 family)